MNEILGQWGAEQDQDEHCPENDGRPMHHNQNENIAPCRVSAHSPLKPVLTIAQGWWPGTR